MSLARLYIFDKEDRSRYHSILTLTPEVALFSRHSFRRPLALFPPQRLGNCQNYFKSLTDELG